jgi:glycosyltransferase involved in cell wall biosynthesis
MKGRIAILVPAFNAGALLGETLASPARAGLPADSYAILVSDNASTDGSTKWLGKADAQGAPVILCRNETNLGRVANWNRAMMGAEDLGFSHAMFLMAGDMLGDDAVIALRDRMIAADAALGIAPYQIVDEDLKPLRIARRIRWRGGAIGQRDFVLQSLGAGALLFGPLGANLYRLGGKAPLRFDPADETHTDQIATALFAQANDARIVYLDRPLSLWRDRRDRFHAGMDADARMAGDLRLIEQGCRAAKVAPDYTKIRASLIVRGLFHKRGLRAAWTQSKILTRNVPPSLYWLAALPWRQALFKTPWRVEAPKS